MITKDLGMVTAYAYAVSKGYTGTEEEFAELMASYASVAQEAVDAALAAAQSAQNAQDAKTAAEGARDTAQNTVSGAIAGIQAEGQTQIGAVQSEGTTQVGNVNSAGQTQVGNVNAAGTTQVGNVNTAGSTQVNAVQAKGTEVLDSIPSDYATLSDDVTDLKSALNNVDTGLNGNTGVFHYDDFAVGALSKSNSVITFDSSDKRMVSTPKSICFPVQITITPVSGYRMYIHWTDGRPYSTSNTGWTTSAVTVQPGQYFMMAMRQVASDTGYEADTVDFVNKFIVSPSPLRIVENAVLQKKTMYVSTGGSDSTGVGTLANPYKTFTKALTEGAEEIIARAGTYKETISKNGGKLKISAYWETFSSGNVTDRPKIVIDGDNTAETALTIENCTEVILSDVVVKNCTEDGALINKCDKIELQNCEFLSNGRNGIVIGYSNGVIRDCKANYNGNDGFNMNYFGDTQFFNCSGHDNGDDGISHHQGTTGCINGGEWYNNVKGGVASPAHGAQVDLLNFYSHNNGYGVYANADSDTVARTFHMWNCVLTNNSHYGLTCKRNTCIMYNCKITGNTEGQTTAPSGGSIITL